MRARFEQNVSKMRALFKGFTLSGGCLKNWRDVLAGFVPPYRLKDQVFGCKLGKNLNPG